MSKIKSVWMYEEEGRFNLMNDKKQTQYVLHVTFEEGDERVTVSELWDDAPYANDNFDDLMPSDLLCVIRDRSNSYLFSSQRERLIAKLDRLDAVAKYLDLKFLKIKKARLDASLSVVVDQIEELEHDVRELEADNAQ